MSDRDFLNVRLCLLVADVSILLQVDLIPHYRQDDISPQYLLQFAHPVLDFLERILIRDIVDQDGAIR